MKRYRYVGKEYTMCPQVEGGPSYKVDAGETIETEMPTKIMLSNQFVLVGQEVDESGKEYSDFVERETAYLNRLDTEYKDYSDKVKAELKAKKEVLDSEKKRVGDILDAKKVEHADRLNVLSKDDDKKISEAAKKALKNLGKIPEVEDVAEEDVEDTTEDDVEDTVEDTVEEVAEEVADTDDVEDTTEEDVVENATEEEAEDTTKEDVKAEPKKPAKKTSGFQSMKK